MDECAQSLDRILNASYIGLVDRGLCIAEFRIAKGQKAGEVRCELPRGVSVDTSDRRGFQGGDAVRVASMDTRGGHQAEDGSGFTAEAEISAVFSGGILLKCQPADIPRLLSQGTLWRLDRMANRVAFMRQLRAVKTVVEVAIDTGPGPNGGDGMNPNRDIVEALIAPVDGVRLMDLCHRQVISKEGKAMQAPGAESAIIAGLNPSQKLAISSATSKRLTLIQGPPGTGKTHTAVQILKHWARDGRGGGPVLATSDSNIAVDNLLDGLIRSGVDAVRLGRPERIRNDLLRYCVDMPQAGRSGIDFAEKKRALARAEVICSTCVGVGSDQLDKVAFRAVLVDEASQATESATIVPLCRGCEQLVLIGDQCQLPPTMSSDRAQAEGLGEPLFTRMVAAGATPYMLDTQCVPSI